MSDGEAKTAFFQAIDELLDEISSFLQHVTARIDSVDDRLHRHKNQAWPETSRTFTPQDCPPFPTRAEDFAPSPLEDTSFRTHETTKNIVETTTATVEEVKKLAIQHGKRMETVICNFASKYVKSVIDLVNRYKATAINAVCPFCKQLLSNALAEADSNLKRLVLICWKVSPSSSLCKRVSSAAEEAHRAFGTLQASLGDPCVPQKEKPFRVRGAQEEDLSLEATKLESATSQVLEAVKVIGERKPRWEVRHRMIAATRTLANATTTLVNHAHLNLWTLAMRHKLDSMSKARWYLLRGSIDPIHHRLTLQLMTDLATQLSISCIRWSRYAKDILKTPEAGQLMRDCVALYRMVQIIQQKTASPIISITSALKAFKCFLQQSDLVLFSFRSALTQMFER